MASTDRSLRALEHELTLVSRHLAVLPSRTRRRGGVLDQSAYTLLMCLEEGGLMSIRDLTDVSGLDTSTINRQTAALLRDGLAERIPDPGGGVARKFRLTAEGRRHLHDERDASVTSLGKITDDWDDADIAQFAELLTRFNRAIEDRTGRHWPRTG